MGKTDIKAQEIIALIKQGKSIIDVKSVTSTNDSEWYRFSNKAYLLYFKEEEKDRKKDAVKSNVSATSNEEISILLSLNEVLANYALSIPIFVIRNEFKVIEELAKDLPNTESPIINLIENIIFNPRIRALQKKGRIEKFDCFKVFSKIIDAALISYYRANYISCYLTLIPVIEGVIIRWMGYEGNESKPDFETIRGFFRNFAIRQPMPTNILFHNVYVKACDNILNNHFYRPTTTGSPYANFNRHIAAHLLNENSFATKENCIRLFLLLDIMTEIFLYESKIKDHRFYLTDDDIKDDVFNYNLLLTTKPEENLEYVILYK